MKQDIKIHELQYQVLVDRLSIEIKFPCKITASFRVGKNESHSNENVGLQNGVAQFTEPLITKGLMHMIDGCYQDKKSYLTIYVLSNSGKNIAGVSTIDLSVHTSEEWKTIDKQLERCPDRNARICLRIRSSFLRELDQCPSQSAKSESFRLHRPQTSRDNINTTLPEPPNHKPLITPFRETRTANPSLRLTNFVTRDRSAQSFRGQSQQKRSDEQGHPLTRTTDQKTRQISSLKDQLTERERRITRLQVQKQSYLREVQGLRVQLDTIKTQFALKTNKQIQLVGQNERIKRKLEASENAMEVLKMKRLELERRENQRKSRTESERGEEAKARAEAVAEMDKEVKATRKSKEEVERMLREKVRELREVNQRGEDLAAAVATLEKRLEIKESFYKEEIRKYNERQIELESERQRLYTELGSLRDNLEQKERKIMSSSKDNERIWVEQKQKLTKRIQSLKVEIETAQLNHQSTIKQMNTQNQQIDRLNQQLHQTFDDNEKTKLELQRVKKQLIVQTNYRLKYEEEQKQKSKLKQQKAGLQKELDDFLENKNMDLQEMTRQVTQKTQHIKSLNEKFNQNNKKMRQKDHKIQQLQNNLDSMAKKYEMLKKADDKKALQLTEFKNLEKTLLLDVQSLDQQRQQLQITIQSMRYKQQAQIDELRKSLKKSVEECQNLKIKFRNETENSAKLMDNNRALNEKNNVNLSTISKLQEKSKKLEKDCMDLGFKQKDLKEQIERLTSILTETKQALKRQNTKNQQYYTKLSKLESDNIRLGLVHQQLIRVETHLKEKDAELSARIQSQARLQISVQKQEASISSLKQDLRIRIGDFNREKMTVEALRKDLSVTNENLQSTHRQLQQKSQELSETKRQLLKISSQRKILQDKLSSTSLDNKKYRQSILQSLRLSFSFLFGSSSTRESPTEPQFSDYELSQLHRQLTRKLSKLQQQHSAQLKICKQHLQESFEQQLELNNKKHSELEAQLTNEFQTKKEEFHYFREGMLVKNEELVREVGEVSQELEEALRELEAVAREKEEVEEGYRRLSVQGEEAEAINEQLQREIDHLKRDVRQMHEEITRERQQKEEIYTKVYSERELTQSKMQASERAMILQIEQLEHTLKDRQVQLDSANSLCKGLSKQLEFKNQTIKNLQKQIQNCATTSSQLQNQINSQLKREKELLEKVRISEQSLILEQEKLSQVKSTLGLIQVKERQVEEIKLSFEREKDNLNKKITFIEHQLKASEQGNIKIKEEIELSQQELYKSQQQARRLADLIKGQQQNLSKKSAQLEEKISENGILKDRVVKLERQLHQKDDMKHEVSSKYQTQLKAIKIEKQELIFKLNQVESDLKKIGDSKATNSKQSQKQVNKLRSERDSLAHKLSQSDHQLKIQLQLVEKLKTSEQALLAEIQSIRSYSQQTEADNVRLQNTLQLRNRQYNQLNKRYQSIDFQYKNIQKTYRQASQRIEQLESMFGEVKNERDSMISVTSERQLIENQFKSTNQRLIETQQQLQKQSVYCASLEQAIQKFKQDKQFIYRQLRQQVQLNKSLGRQKQQLMHINQDKLAGILTISSQHTLQRTTLQRTILQLSDKLQKQKSDMIKFQTQKHQLFKRIQQQQREHKADNYKHETEIRQLVKAKTGLLNNLEQMSIQVTKEKEELERMYDREFRAVEAKRIQDNREAEDRVKRVYQEKYEDQAVLRFEIERLKAEKGGSSLQSSMRSSVSVSVLQSNQTEFKQEITEAKMKHYLAKQPLRNLQALLPHILWLSQQNEKLLLSRQSRIRELEQKSHNYYISPNKMVQQQPKPQSQLIQKVRQAEANVRITFNRVQQMGQQLQQLTEEKLKILGKSRELQDLVGLGSETFVLQDKLCEILDYSRINIEVRNYTTTPPGSEGSLRRGIQRVDSNVVVMPEEVWYEQSVAKNTL